VDAFDPPQKLTEREKTMAFLLLAHHRHQIDQRGRARPAFERRLQNIRAGNVAPRRTKLAGRPDREVSALLIVENARKHGWRIESRPAKPVDRTLARDQRGRARATDDRVAGDWGIPITHSPCATLPRGAARGGRWPARSARGS